MITDLVVFGSIGLSVAFFAVWLVRPGFRAWVERPKHAFNARALRYDREAVHASRLDEGSRGGDASA